MEPPADRRSRSCMHGSSYQLRLAMVVMLRAFHLRRDGILSDFNITLDDPEAGKFDDVVFRYSLASIPNECAQIYIQSKHKQTQDPMKKIHAINEASLVAKWNSKAPFSIPMLFVSYLAGFEQTLPSTSTFILCTNASLSKKLNKLFTVRPQPPGHILSFCSEIGATCYSLNREAEWKALVDELRIASVERLGQLLAWHIKSKEVIKSSMATFKIHQPLIAKCIELRDQRTFRFNRKFQKADHATLMGKLRQSLQEEYIKLPPNKPISWKDVSIVFEKSFFDCTWTDISESACFAAVDAVIQQFMRQFLLVCGTLDETALHTQIFAMMPKWVHNPNDIYSHMHNMLFDSMVRARNLTLNDLQRHFVEASTNEVFARVQTYTKEYIGTLRVRYPHVVVEPHWLQSTALHNYLASASYSDGYRYMGTTNRKMNAIIVLQSAALHQRECLLVDGTSMKCVANMLRTLGELVEYVAAVGLSTKYIITIVGQQDSAVRTAVRNYATSYKLKIVTVEEPAGKDSSNDGPRLGNLTVNARRQLLKEEFNLFGTITALDRIVRGDDTVCGLLSMLDACDRPKMVENINVKHFKTIKPWYIPRSCVPYTEQGEELPAEHVDEGELSISVLKSILLQKHEDIQLPDEFTRVNSPKVHCLLDVAGAGKTTFFTRLALALSMTNASWHVVRINALHHCAEFEALDANPFDQETEVVRIFYRLLHLTQFVTGSSSTTSTKEEEKRKADRIAELFEVVRGKINLKEAKIKQMQPSSEELLQLRWFHSKFNEKQLVCLVDAMDELKLEDEFCCMYFFKRLASFDGIRQLYVAARQTNFIDVLNNTFPGCKMWRLVPFSPRDRVLFVHNYLERNLSVYKASNESHKLKMLQTVHMLTVDSARELKAVPLCLKLAAKQVLANVNTASSVQSQLDEMACDPLQVMNSFAGGSLRTLTDANNLSLLAMLVLFNADARTRLFSERENYAANKFTLDIELGKERTGMVRFVRPGSLPQFNYRIFADFYAASWLYRNKHLMKCDSFFHSFVFWDSDVDKTRDLFNRMIISASIGCELHLAVMNRSASRVRELLSKNASAALATDAVGRLPLHVAMMYPGGEIVQLLTRTMSLQSLNTQDDLFQWTAVDYAFATSNYDVLNHLLTIGAAINENTLYKQVISNKLKALLAILHVHGIVSLSCHYLTMCMKRLHIQTAQHLLNERQLNVFTPHDELDYLSVLEFCSQHAMVDMLRQLMFQQRVRENITPDTFNWLYEIAQENKAFSSVMFLNENRDTFCPQTPPTSADGSESSDKSRTYGCSIM
uniref:Uncharacterized protein n=1 Tax=Anopheles culicifacies TaxID=139723 RepID=A0A182LY56_9DIPT